MKKANIQNLVPEPKRRLSFWRLMLAVFILTGLTYYGIKNWKSIKETITTDPIKPWFAPYVDVTATPIYQFEQGEVASNQRNLVLSFIVSSKEDSCIPTWGSAYTLDEAGVKLDLDRRTARFRQLGGNIAISFGGLLNEELSVNCKDESKLQNAYLQVIERYNIDTIDIDLEGPELKDSESLKRRSVVLSKIQKALRSDNKKLAIWLTLPVSPNGLTDEGADAVLAMLTNGVDLAGVNVMTMDYGESRSKNQTMYQASERALVETHRQLGILYKKAGITLTSNTLWTKIGATPMIGQNDIAGEIFTLEDAVLFNKLALSKNISRISMWSANRDIECGENYVNVNIVSDSCSGINQDKYDFSIKLGTNFDSSITESSSAVTKNEAENEQKTDNPDESPYQIWTENGTYLEGTKVVWHRNVYQAKWWTRGDVPDNPVLQSFETPWQLIGPVLPGEKPVPQLTLPEGTYPQWSGVEIYQEGQRVLFDNTPYQAKWWTQGDSPAASSSNPDSSPWVILTQAEIEGI